MSLLLITLSTNHVSKITQFLKKILLSKIKLLLRSKVTKIKIIIKMN